MITVALIMMVSEEVMMMVSFCGVLGSDDSSLEGV